ncbi:hypothetical protein [Naasia lichenicola]|uniref:hypothetical protein n=1 Tax=Naasia lichenicola TaxID=2565933 RepID=UPI00130ED87B|nr:hypothetical protein [Naasia lichenicola]
MTRNPHRPPSWWIHETGGAPRWLLATLFALILGSATVVYLFGSGLAHPLL